MGSRHPIYYSWSLSLLPPVESVPFSFIPMCYSFKHSSRECVLCVLKQCQMMLAKERYDHSELCAVWIVSYSCHLVINCWLLSAGCESLSLPTVAPLPRLSPSHPPTVGITQLLAGAFRREAWQDDCADASVWQCACDGDGDGLEYVEWRMETDRRRNPLWTPLFAFLLHSSFPSSLTHPPFLHPSSTKVADKDGQATIAGLWLAVTAEWGFKGAAAIFAEAKLSLCKGRGFFTIKPHPKMLSSLTWNLYSKDLIAKCPHVGGRC